MNSCQGAPRSADQTRDLASPLSASTRLAEVICCHLEVICPLRARLPTRFGTWGLRARTFLILPSRYPAPGVTCGVENRAGERMWARTRRDSDRCMDIRRCYSNRPHSLVHWAQQAGAKRSCRGAGRSLSQRASHNPKPHRHRMAVAWPWVCGLRSAVAGTAGQLPMQASQSVEPGTRLTGRSAESPRSAQRNCPQSSPHRRSLSIKLNSDRQRPELRL